LDGRRHESEESALSREQLTKLQEDRLGRETATQNEQSVLAAERVLISALQKKFQATIKLRQEAILACIADNNE